MTIVLLTASGTRAAIWLDAGPSNVWDLSAANWDIGVWTNGGAAVFNGGGETVEVDAAITTTGVTFSAGGYTLADGNSNGSLTFLGGNATVVTNSVGANTIGANIILGGTAGLKTFLAAPNGHLTLSGNISDGVAGSTVVLNRTSSTTPFSWTLSGNNTHATGTQLSGSGGTFNIGSGRALGTGALTLATTAVTVNNTYGAALSFKNTLAMGIGNVGFAFGPNTGFGTGDMSFGTLSVNNNNAATTSLKTLTINGGTTISVAGIQQINAGTGGVSLVTAGTGKLVIAGASNHTGVTQLGSTAAVLGNVSIGHRESLGLGAVELRFTNLSATTDLTGSNKITNNLTITTGSGQTTVFSGTNSMEFSGTNSASSATRNYANHISGGTLTFSGAQTLASGSTFTVAGTGSTVFTQGLTPASGTPNFSYIGTGSLLLQGASTYAGTSTFANGTVTLDKGAGGSLSSTSAFNLGGTFILMGASSGSSSQAFNTPTFSNTAGGAASGSVIIIDANGGAGTTLTLGDTWIRGGQASLHVDLSTTGSALTSNPTVTSSVVAATGPGVSTAYVTVRDGGGTGFATVSGGNNVVRYTGASTLTTADPGVAANVVTKVSDPAYAGGTLTLAGSSSVNTLQLDTSAGAGTLDLNGGTLTLGSRAVLATGTNDFTIQNGKLGLDATEVVIHQHSTGTVTVNSQITGDIGTLTKAGSGKLVINSANTFTGTVSVTAGILEVRNDTALGTAAAASGSVVSNRATLAINGTGGNLTIGNEQLRLMGNGAAGQSGALVNVGGTNSYGGQLILHGGTTIASDAGTLNLTSTSVLTTAVTGGAPLTLAGAGNGSIAAPITATGVTGVTSLTKNGEGTWTLTGVNNFAGATVINAGTLALSGSGSLASTSIVVGGTLNVSGTASGGITLAAGQKVSGGGTVIGKLSGSANSTISPGTGYGTLTVQNGDFTLGSAALAIEVGKFTPGSTPTAGSDYDQIAVTGASNVDVTGGNLMVATYAGLEVGDILYILSASGADAIIGTFARHDGVNEALAEGATFTTGLYTFQITYAADANVGFTGGNDIALLATAVPEPSAVGLLGLSLTSLLARRRRSSWGQD